MELSFAPLQGLTYCTLRTIHARLFGCVDKYYSPFIAPDSTGSYKVGDMRDVLPENNMGIDLVPQILANNPEAFISVAGELSAMGYEEINLNVGCPSGTVFAKHKGSGMLTDLDSLESFLDAVYSACDMKISIKTRMGVKTTDEFGRILDIYNKYPIYQLLIHARSREGMYWSIPDKTGVAAVLKSAKMPVIYNGNIFHASDAQQIVEYLPSINGLMIGRGACIDPSLFRQIKGGGKADCYELKNYHDTYLAATLSSDLCEAYTVGRMKELWSYMILSFGDFKKQYKALVKTRALCDYKSASAAIFRECPLAEYTEEEISAFLNLHISGKAPLK